jgi:hypothetical protein
MPEEAITPPNAEISTPEVIAVTTVEIIPPDEPIRRRPPRGFDYDTIQNQEKREKVRTSAKVILENIGRENDAQYKIGGELRRVKDRILSRGQFGEWIKTEFGFSWATANRYMRQHKVLTPTEFRTLRNLGATNQAINSFVSIRTPATVRAQLFADLDNGSIQRRHPAINDLIRDRIALARAGQPNEHDEYMRQRQAVLEAKQLEAAVTAMGIVHLLPARCQVDFKRCVDFADEMFLRVLRAEEAQYYERGFLTDHPFDARTGAPLSNRQLIDHQLAEATDAAAQEYRARLDADPDAQAEIEAEKKAKLEAKAKEDPVRAEATARQDAHWNEVKRRLAEKRAAAGDASVAQSDLRTQLAEGSAAANGAEASVTKTTKLQRPE